MWKIFFIFILIVCSNIIFAQDKNVSVLTINQDSVASSQLKSKPVPKINYWGLVLPTAGIVYGLIALESDDLKSLNIEIKQEVKEHIDKRFTIDDISQYSPAASVYLFNAFGLKGKHSLVDRTMILSMSYVIMAGSVNGLKKWAKEERPDSSSNNSFPSGHTATAFLGAEFLYQEFKDQSIWYGLAGYAIAAGTGGFRIYNNRHWFSDVLAGAGIGILSTKISYWVYPWLRQKFNKKEKPKVNGFALPFYNGKQMGLGMVISF